MTHISNPQETARVWREALERELQTYQSNVSRACPGNRALTAMEI
jgi:hypothetical protein